MSSVDDERERRRKEALQQFEDELLRQEEEQLRQKDPELWAAFDHLARTGDMSRLPPEVQQELLQPDSLKDFLINCRANEIGGLRVLWRRRIRLGGWLMKLRAKWTLRRLVKEQAVIMQGLTAAEKILFIRNVWHGSQEVEEILGGGSD